MATPGEKTICKTTLFAIEDPSRWDYYHFLEWFGKHNFTIDIAVNKYASSAHGPYWVLGYPTIEHYDENGIREEYYGSEDCIEFLESKIK